MKEQATDKTKLGLYNKFNVTRTDGRDAAGEKHFGCDYFVLDLTHDKFARDAIRAYAKACEKEFPKLASDLLNRVGTSAPRNRALAYFIEKKTASPSYVPKKYFDLLAKKGRFADGPFVDSFGDGPGEPYNPNRQAYGIDKNGTGIFTELNGK